MPQSRQTKTKHRNNQTTRAKCSQRLSKSKQLPQKQTTVNTNHPSQNHQLQPKKYRPRQGQTTLLRPTKTKMARRATGGGTGAVILTTNLHNIHHIQLIMFGRYSLHTTKQQQ